MLREYFSEDVQQDQTDKDVLSFSNYIIKNGCLQPDGILCSFEVLYPFKSKNLKTYAYQSISTILQNSSPNFKFFNTLNIENSLKYFYKLTN